MDFAQVIKDRYSCKKYDGKPVTAEQLSSILEAGRLAPHCQEPARAAYLCCPVRRGAG